MGENVGWAANMLSYSSRPPDPALVGDDYASMWRERLEHMPLLADTWLRYQWRDAYWRHGSVCEDYWLRDIDTGVERDPDYRAWLMDSIAPARWLPERPGRWIAEREWPSPRIAGRFRCASRPRARTALRQHHPRALAHPS